MFRTCESDFNLGRHLIPFLQDVAFYAEMSRHIHKRFTTDVSTAAICYDQKLDELVMYVNPYFMGGGEYKDPHDPNGEIIKCEPLENGEIRGTITHEYDHMVFGHLNVRRRKPGDLWNQATDCAINSGIVTNSGRSWNALGDPSARQLPKIVLVPGHRPYIDPEKFKKLTPEQQMRTEHLCELVESFPPGKASEWYFMKLQEDQKKNGGNPNEGDGEGHTIGGFDDHGGWDELPEDMREYIEGKVKSIIEKAVRAADSRSDGWGNIPAELREEIRRSVSNIVNWRNVLRQFVGQLVRGNRTTSIKRINRRYPYIHPGLKRGYTAKLLIAIDESGSVSNDMMEMFFSELEGLTKKVDVTLLHFDCSCDMSDIYEWRKGTRPKLNRVKTGGTNFQAPTDLANDPKNRGRWDGMLIMTDGQAEAPGTSRIKRGWILGQGCTLNFQSSEMQIFLSKERPMSGAWR